MSMCCGTLQCRPIINLVVRKFQKTINKPVYKELPLYSEYKGIEQLPYEYGHHLDFTGEMSDVNLWTNVNCPWHLFSTKFSANSLLKTVLYRL